MNIIGYLDSLVEESTPKLTTEIFIPPNIIKKYIKPKPSEKQLLAEKSYNALVSLVDYIYNRESPAKIIERKPDLDYYDSYISKKKIANDYFIEASTINARRDRTYLGFGEDPNWSRDKRRRRLG